MNVITLGTFDMFHFGHLKLFKRCKSYAENGKFIVGLNTDEFIEKYKGKSPIMNYQERSEIINELNLVDFVVPNNQSDGTIKGLLLEHNVDLIVIGSDWFRKDYLTQVGVTIEWMEENNISLCFVPYTIGISTTEIKKRLLK